MKKTIAIMLVMLFAVGTSLAFAAEMEDPVTGTVKTVGKAAKGTVDTAVSPIKALGEGRPDKAITDPVEKGAQTVGDAAVDTGKTVTMQEVSMDDEY